MKKYLMDFQADDTPKYIQIERHLKKLVDSSLIEDGEKLPSIRTLAKLLNVNNDTIVGAYKKLQAEGYAEQRIGSGTYAKRKELGRNFKKEYSDTFKRLSADELRGYIDFTGETTSSSFFPVATFKSVLNEVLDRDGAEALIYQDFLGYKRLRDNINTFFWEGALDSENILIVSGAQQGIDIVSKALIGVNDNIIIERPTYSGALSVFKGRRANIFEIDILEDGIDLAHFERILKKNNIKCFYTMSYFQNPTGYTYSLEKKMELLRLAEQYDFYIIEDDYLSELIYDINIDYISFKAIDKNDRVIYIKSFSKIFLPGIRIGYLISPDKFTDTIQNSKINTDISTSSLMQRALDLYIEKGYWKEHINYLRMVYNERYTFMKEKLQTTLSEKVHYKNPGGGLNFYLKLDNKVNIDSITLFYRCKEKNVLITPGVLFYKNSRMGSDFFKIGFSQVSNDQIMDGLSIIDNILKGSD